MKEEGCVKSGGKGQGWGLRACIFGGLGGVTKCSVAGRSGQAVGGKGMLRAFTVGNIGGW